MGDAYFENKSQFIDLKSCLKRFDINMAIGSKYNKSNVNISYIKGKKIYLFIYIFHKLKFIII